MKATRFPNGLGWTVTGRHQGRDWTADVWDVGQVNVFDVEWGGCRASASNQDVSDPKAAAQSVVRGHAGEQTDDWMDWMSRQRNRKPSRAPLVVDDEDRKAVLRWAAGRKKR